MHSQNKFQISMKYFCEDFKKLKVQGCQHSEKRRKKPKPSFLPQISRRYKHSCHPLVVHMSLKNLIMSEFHSLTYYNNFTLKSPEDGGENVHFFCYSRVSIV